MIGSASSPAASPPPSSHASPVARADPHGRGGGVRVLARGRLFESIGREGGEAAPPSCHGRGLIRLADGSGWAIVPSDADLRDQFVRLYDGSFDEGDMAAYEEIGSALAPPDAASGGHPQQRFAGSTAGEKVEWLRIVAPPDGIRVLLPPPRKEDEGAAGVKDAESSPAVASSRSPQGEEPEGARQTACGDDSSSDVASSLAGSFLDSMLGLGFRGRGQERQPQHGTSLPKRREDRGDLPPVIACGMIVPVSPSSAPPSGWLGIHRDEGDKCFARLANGHGWIPRRLGGLLYTADSSPPKIRSGSFWFRVRCRSGVPARRGPSALAPAISSGNGEGGAPPTPLRFECGEYLRA